MNGIPLVGLVYFFSLSLLPSLCESNILVLSYVEVFGKGLISIQIEDNLDNKFMCVP